MFEAAISSLGSTGNQSDLVVALIEMVGGGLIWQMAEKRKTRESNMRQPESNARMDEVYVVFSYGLSHVLGLIPHNSFPFPHRPHQPPVLHHYLACHLKGGQYQHHLRRASFKSRPKIHFTSSPQVLSRSFAFPPLSTLSSRL